MTTQTTNRSTTGIVLVIVGIALFAMQFLRGLGAEIFLFGLSAAFLAGYLIWRIYGFLIPSGILLGVGLSMLGGHWAALWGNFGGIGLGLGFVSIYLIALFVEGRSPWWPLIPGAALILSGMATGSAMAASLLSMGWPIILVLVGLAVLMQTRARD